MLPSLFPQEVTTGILLTYVPLFWFTTISSKTWRAS